VGYLRGVIHGVAIGSVVALLYAPKPGIDMRRDLSAKLEKVRGQAQPVIEQAQTTIDKARPQGERVASTAQETVGRVAASQSGTGAA